MIKFWVFKILGLIAVLFEAYNLNVYLYLNTVRYEFKNFLHIKYTFRGFNSPVQQAVDDQ